jgi:beta-galactosidase
VVATYGQDFYAGTPVVTANRFGQGRAIYIATDPDEAFLDAFYDRLLDEHGIRSTLAAPKGVEVALRERDDGRLLFVLNHNPEPARVQLPADATYRELLGDRTVSREIELAAYDVRILAES